MIRSINFILFISGFISLLFLQSCDQQNKQQLIIFHAGSLSVPVQQINQAFNKLHPEVEIRAEAAGSVACARKITDLKLPCDVMLSADYNVIDKFLIPKFSSWNLKFASNEMVIAFTGNSAEAGKINSKNWTEILRNKKVRYGRSNPNSDPCGYRTVLCLKLADRFYHQPELSGFLLPKDNIYIRPKETDLIALLETQTIDYIFIYRSVAVQHDLNYITLPDSVNLKNPGLANWYRIASVAIDGKSPGEKITQRGEPMIYGLTIPDDAPHPDLAVEYVRFLLSSDKGMKIMEENGQPSLVPAPSATWQHIPEALQPFALPAKP